MAPHQLDTVLHPLPSFVDGKAVAAKHLEKLRNSSDSGISSNDLRILDIRQKGVPLSLVDGILGGLVGKPAGEKSLPTLLLYSAEGLKIFEEITYSEEYYLTNTEIGILEKHAADMADRIEDGSMVVELGSGNLRKVNILLKALDRTGKRISYYALDLDRSELERTLAMIHPGDFKNIECFGLHGTYEDGRVWLKQKNPDLPRCILWLGSSAGNMDLAEVSEFLREYSADALRPGKRDIMLVGLDGTKDADKVYRAYNDTEGITERFELAGLKNANEILGGDYFSLDDWEYIGEWNAETGGHQAYLAPKKDISFGGQLQGVTVTKGERIHIENSFKYDAEDAKCLWDAAGMKEGAQWSSPDGNYSLHMIYRPRFQFSMVPTDYASDPVPTLAEWEELWASWDAVTLEMIPRDQLNSKPIDLRNPCSFYLGHIPNFLDVQIVRVTGEAPTPPAPYAEIFQRGIDPDVDNPESCHAHSTVPDSWPSLKEIREYTDKVRQRLRAFYRDGSTANLPRLLQRAIFIGFEHEAMHLETLLYMLIQSDKTLPPPGTVFPDFVSGRTSEQSRKNQALDENPWIDIPAMKLDLGIDDLETEDDDITKRHYFGWDNEKPVQHVRTAAFRARAGPITNGEYASFLHATNCDKVPVSWTTRQHLQNGALEVIEKADADMAGEGDESLKRFMDSQYVFTFYGPVPLRLAADWPVMASYDELKKAAEWMGGRIPTKEEVNALYRFAETAGQRDTTAKKLSGKYAAVNGHLTQKGVTETPPSQLLQRDELFQDLTGRNVGFANWHPTSVRTGDGRLRGRGDMGGAWEWTSSKLEEREGFVPTKLYPEYTADFFDGKHNVVLGGSWATHPRIAGRKSFVNWYQRNYRYMWATARVVTDLQQPATTETPAQRST